MNAIRYHIADELWASFTVEQVNKQISRLISTGRYRLPNNGGSYTVRLACGTLYDFPGGFNDDDQQEFDDFDFCGDEFKAARTFVRRRFSPNLPISVRHNLLKGCEAEWGHGPYWWEGDYVCNYSAETPQAETLALMPLVEKVLIILLHDRMTHKIEIEPRQPSKLHKLGIGKKRPDVFDDAAEIVLTIPRRIYTGEHGGTHASPRTHYRAEHVRQQPYGPRSHPQFREVVIEGGWVNKDDLDPNEPLTPIRLRAYRLQQTGIPQ